MNDNEQRPIIKSGCTLEQLEEMFTREEEEERLQEERLKKEQIDKENRKLLIPVFFVIVLLLVGFAYNHVLSTDQFVLKEYQDMTDVPMLYQTDDKWENEPYAGSTIKVAGCGPTCLSMIHIYMNGDLSYNPAYMARFSEENNYAVPGYGTKWTLFSEGAKKLGLNSKNISPDEKLVMRNLKAGNPIVCVMGPGHFTKTGHFIVFGGVVDGKIVVNDPNAGPDDKRLWAFKTFKKQIKDMWLFVQPNDKK